MSRIAVIMFCTDYSIQPVELARALEERDFEGLFLTEHTHIPASRESESYLGGELPKEYWHAHDPFVALGAAAAVTERLTLGTAICLVTEHNPITLAKSVASVDVVSNGRFVLGIGAGWNAEEMKNHGVPFAERWQITRERVLAMREIWTKAEPEYHGKHVDFEPLWSYPKPVQQGGPKVLLGAGSKWSYDRVAEYCDGWMPIDGHDDIEVGLAQIRAAFDRAGRSPDTFSWSVAAAPDPARIAELLELGAERILLQLPSEPADGVMRVLDDYAEIVRSFS
jgi:probable F420-dependent oxidoreductase